MDKDIQAMHSTKTHHLAGLLPISTQKCVSNCSLQTSLNLDGYTNSTKSTRYKGLVQYSLTSPEVVTWPNHEATPPRDPGSPSMAEAEEKVVLEFRDVKYKKELGVLVLTSLRVAWAPGDIVQTFQADFPYQQIKGG